MGQRPVPRGRIMSGSSKKPWGGRFKKATDVLTEAFTESVSFDRVLYLHDITGSMAHATMLAQVGLISQGEREAIIKGLKEISEEIGAGSFNFRREYEDIHM